MKTFKVEWETTELVHPCDRSEFKIVPDPYYATCRGLTLVKAESALQAKRFVKDACWPSRSIVSVVG